jgi:hypothetical protein
MPQLEAGSRKASASHTTGDRFLTVLHMLADHPQSRPPIWVILALQIHMDIHDIVGLNVEREVFQFQKSIAANLGRMQALHDLVDERLSGALRHTLLEDCVEMEETFKQLAKDPYDHTDLKRTKSTPPPKEVYPIYKAFPAIPRQNVKIVAVALHNQGITCSDVGRIVLSAAYLYRAATKSAQ